MSCSATTHSTGLRHLTLDALGQGQRELRVSYISEVPVWKSTYRIVFPRTPNGNATVQGWAVVDNTVGADWDNVQLSLVAGAPQSFIQPLSQPLYTRRPEIPIATEAQLTPQTHEAAEINENKAVEAESAPSPAIVPRSIAQSAMKARASSVFGVAGMEGLGTGPGGGVGVGSSHGYGYGAGSGGSASGGVYRASDAIQEGDVSTNAFDDFFEYALTQPVTIHKNESAMVPILQQELPAEHVTLWSESESHAAARRLAGEQVQADARLGQLLHLRERRVCRRGPARSHPSRREAPALLRRRSGRPRESHGPRQPAHPASRQDRQGRHRRNPHGCGLGDLLGHQLTPRRTAMVLLEHPRRNNGWTPGRGPEGR